jgi:hypothetical protein
VCLAHAGLAEEQDGGGAVDAVGMLDVFEESQQPRAAADDSASLVDLFAVLPLRVEAPPIEGGARR